MFFLTQFTLQIMLLKKSVDMKSTIFKLWPITTFRQICLLLLNRMLKKNCSPNIFNNVPHFPIKTKLFRLKPRLFLTLNLPAKKKLQTWKCTVQNAHYTIPTTHYPQHTPHCTQLTTHHTASCTLKNPAYGRHWISRPMRIIRPIFFFGGGMVKNK